MKEIQRGSLFGKGLRHIQHLSDFTDEQSNHEASTQTNDQLEYLRSHESSQFEEFDSEFQQLNSTCLKRQLQKASLDSLRLFLEKEFDLRKYEHQEIVIDIFSQSLPRRNSSNFIPRRNRAILDSILHTVSLFRSSHQIQNYKPLSSKLLGQLRLEFYPKGSVLFQHGDVGTTFYIIIRGSAYCLLEDQRHQSFSRTNQVLLKKEKSTDQFNGNGSNRIPLNIHKNKELNQKKLNSPSFPGNKPIASSVTSFEAEQNALKEIFPTLSMVRILKPGDSFGEIALLTEQTRTATVLLREDTHLLVLSKDAYSEVLGEQESQILRDRCNYLRDFECFRDYDLSQLLQLLHCMERQVLSNKNVVFQEGEISDRVFFLKNGEVKLTKKTQNKQQEQDPNEGNHHINIIQQSRRVQLVILSSPACFGDENLFKEQQQLRAQSAVVSSASAEILSIDQAVFKNELRKHGYYATYEQQIMIKNSLRNKQAHNFAEIHENSPKIRRSPKRKQSESTPKQHEISFHSTQETPQLSPQPSRLQILQEQQQVSRLSISEKSIHFQQEVMKMSSSNGSRFLNSNNQANNNASGSSPQNIAKKSQIEQFCQTPNKAAGNFESTSNSFISQQPESIPCNKNFELIRDNSCSTRFSKFYKLPRLDLSKIDSQSSYFPSNSKDSSRLSDKSEDSLEQKQQKQQLQPSRSQDHRETYFPKHKGLELQSQQVTPHSAVKLQRILNKNEINENPYFSNANKKEKSQVTVSFHQAHKSSLKSLELSTKSYSNINNNNSLERKLLLEKGEKVDISHNRGDSPQTNKNNTTHKIFCLHHSSHESAIQDPQKGQNQQIEQSFRKNNISDPHQPLSPSKPQEKKQLSAAQIIKIHKALLQNIKGGPELLADLSFREQLKKQQFLREQLDAWGFFETGINSHNTSDNKESAKNFRIGQNNCRVFHADTEIKSIPQSNNISIYASNNDNRNRQNGQFRFFHGEKQHNLKLSNWKKSQEQLFKPTKIKKLIGNLEVKSLWTGGSNIKNGMKIQNLQQIIHSNSKVSNVLLDEEVEPK